MNDIIYQDKDVTILDPNVKKGVIIFTNYVQPTNKNSLCKIGLKTGKQLQSEGINFGRSVYHPYIFFRAPYYSNLINYDSIKDEIISSYGDIDMRNKIFIRVDPDTTNVYSSEIRTTSEYWNRPLIINNSKKSLTKYLQIINNNLIVKEDISSNIKIVYKEYKTIYNYERTSLQKKIIILSILKFH